MRKIIISIILMIVTVFIVMGCGSEPAPAAQIEVPPEGQEEVEEMVVDDEDEMEEQEEETEVEEPMEVAASTTKEFTIHAKQWEFEPATITVSEGDTVILHLTSDDVSHGYSISEFGVHSSFSSGETKTVEFVADKKGTFTTKCSVPCGSGHGSMTGTLIVE
jgi:cytochrome c oxidase subunit II